MGVGSEGDGDGCGGVDLFDGVLDLLLFVLGVFVGEVGCEVDFVSVGVWWGW